MFSKLFSKEKPNVYLGSLVVAPSDSWTSESEGWGLFETTDLEAGLRESIEKVIELPRRRDIDSHKETDLALEMVVVEHQGGEFDSLSTSEIFLPIFWRPKVKIKARLYEIKSGKTFAVASSKKSITWGDFFNRSFSLRGLFRFSPLFGNKDMEALLCLAAIDVLQSLKKKL